MCTYENRLANSNAMFGKGHGIEFHGSEGTMLLDRSGFEVFPEKRRTQDGREVARTARQELRNPGPAVRGLFGREYRAPWKLPV